MTRGMAANTAFRAGGVGSNSNTVAEVLKEATIARPELGEGDSLGTGEVSLRFVDSRGFGPQEWMRAKVVDDAMDRVGVDFVDRLLVILLGKDVVGEKRRDDIGVF